MKKQCLEIESFTEILYNQRAMVNRNNTHLINTELEKT